MSQQLVAALPRSEHTTVRKRESLAINGGNAGATYTNDFIELFNDGPNALSLNGLSVQYGSATGCGNIGFNAGAITVLPNNLLQPWHYFLIQESAGGGGTTALPTPDVIDAIAMSATVLG